jgi:hypothetical protein
MPKKNRRPEQLKVGDTVNLADLPPGSIVADVTYIYFLVDALANLRKELDNQDKTLRKAFEVARLTEDQIRITLEQLNRYRDGAISLHDASAMLFHVVEPTPLEIILNEVIQSLGFNHLTPDSRGKLGLKLCDAVTTKEVSLETKLGYLETFGQNTISRMIDDI